MYIPVAGFTNFVAVLEDTIIGTSVIATVGNSPVLRHTCNYVVYCNVCIVELVFNLDYENKEYK